MFQVNISKLEGDLYYFM